MPKKDIAIVFDCGATNLRVIAMDTSGAIIASKSMPNETDQDPLYPEGRIWDVEKLWLKFCKASKYVMESINGQRIVGVTVTTFGVDGTFIDQNDQLLYPVISWQCTRTQNIMQNIGHYIPLEYLYQVSGVFPYPFNTISKMIWFKENKPEVISKAKQFLFLPSLFLRKLGGQAINDTTMMGTSMMADLKARKFSDDILNRLGLSPELFGPLANPGDEAGTIDTEGAKATGLPKGTPLFLSGHDTQFAIFGSGAGLSQPVLSSGTWEILMARSNNFTATQSELELGLTTEADAEPGVYTIGQNWLGSGVLEWFSKNFYPGLSSEVLYNTMIGDAENVKPGAHGLNIDPAFFAESDSRGGTIHGITIHTTPGEIYRALLESLAFRLREGLETLQSAGKFQAERLICVGGGSKNRLWNQIRADVCKVPIQLIEHKETTVLGAALFIFGSSGIYADANEARQQIQYNAQIFKPSEETSAYEALYEEYLDLKQRMKLV
ncbi:MAG: L-fuculokinase [Prolixibacteraceae bacterium]|nr:L-fuculokinase [Prolixibacteraceae bacterium]